MYAETDWSRGYELVDKELPKIAGDSATGRRHVDLLFKVWLLSGEETWVLVHLEVQAQRDNEFPKRIFIYHQRVRELEGRPPVSFPVLVDEDPLWRPESYAYGRWGCSNVFRYPHREAAGLWRHDR